MAVTLDATSQGIAQLGASATSGTLTQTHTVNAGAPAVTVALFVYVEANVSLSGATISATYGGTAMTMAGSVVYFGSDENALAVFTLANPPTGAQQWEVSVSGVATNAAGFWIMGCCESNSGVLAVGTPVTVTGDTAGAATANTLTVDSVSPAYKVVTGHAVREPNLFSGYSQTVRAAVSGAYAYTAYLLGLFFLPYAASATGGELLVGDAPGAPTVTATATQPSTALWAAIGLPLTPAPVLGAAAAQVAATVAVSASLTRTATPSPLRTWVIGGTNS